MRRNRRAERHSPNPPRGRTRRRLIASAQGAQRRDLDNQEQGEDAWLAEMALISRCFVAVWSRGQPGFRGRFLSTSGWGTALRICEGCVAGGTVSSPRHGYLVSKFHFLFAR